MTTLINNPVIWADVPDVDIICHNEYFYMVSTSMHVMPGCPIMRSKDMSNWEIVNYVYDTLENNDAHQLVDGKHIYGKGSWAASLRKHEEKFYVCFSCNDMHQFYIYSTSNIDQGDWERVVIPRLFHDPSLLFDDGRVFVIYGNGNIHITELTSDVSAIKEDGINQLLFETERENIGLRAEGCHAYKINGVYYLFFIEWPRNGHGRRRQLCYRSTQLLGPYEYRIILDDDMQYHNKGVAQGGIVQAPDQKWYSLLFQDHDAVGRIPVALPMTWENGWPVIGIEGKAPLSFEASLPYTPVQPIVVSDQFDYETNKLALQWQWNHNPNNELWSVTDRRGFLRLKTGEVVQTVLQARNTLTQRTEGPACVDVTSIDLSGMKPGDRAGLVALQSNFGTVGVEINENGKATLAMTVNDGAGLERVVEAIPYNQSTVTIKIEFNFTDSIDQATFYYYSDAGEWIPIGEQLSMKYTLDHFMGYRIGLYNYATKQSGGYADFDYFHHYKWMDGQYQLITSK